MHLHFAKKEVPMPNREIARRNGSRDLAPLTGNPLAVFRREMDRLFDDFFSPSAYRPGAEGALASMAPSIDVHETPAAYTVTAELPGLDVKDVELELRDNALFLTGEKRKEETAKEGEQTWTERSYGRFQRVIPLESEVDADKVEASCKNGVLTVKLPKNEKAQDKARKIAIKPN
jgi:HSP20 family protein